MTKGKTKKEENRTKYMPQRSSSSTSCIIIKRVSQPAAE
jgi:hypothetical protein